MKLRSDDPSWLGHGQGIKDPFPFQSHNSSAENQKGTNAVQQCSIENQKGASAIDFVQR